MNLWRHIDLAQCTKFRLCMSFSIWKGNKVKGYCISAFRLGAFFSALTNSALPLRSKQQSVLSKQHPINVKNNKLLLTKVTSRLQWATVIVTKSSPSQKPMPSSRRVLVVVNSKNTPSPVPKQGQGVSAVKRNNDEAKFETKRCSI